MTPTNETAVIFETENFSLVLFPGKTLPSLALSVETALHLWTALNAAAQSIGSLSHTPKVRPIEKLCSQLEEILSDFNRGLAEWQAATSLEPAEKLATVELLAALRQIEKFHINQHPDNIE